jgi:hypothetical protein
MRDCGDCIIYWYDLNTSEICDLLDCGGGRAAPRIDILSLVDVYTTEKYSQLDSSR